MRLGFDYAYGERRHLALENAVLLPLARRRLKAKDLEALAASLTARHQPASIT